MYRPILSLKLKQGSIRTRVSWTTLLAAVVLLSLGGAAQKSATVWWPQFRGPNSSGLGQGRPPVHFGPDKNALWKTAVGAGLSSPIVWEGRIFLTEFDRAKKQLSTLCIDRRTGKILWRRTVAPEQIEKVHELSSPAGATPVTDGESVYVYFGSYGLLSYDLNGNLKWERRLPSPENPYGAVSSPIVAGELLVLNHQGKDAYLLGVNRRDGRTVWKTDRSMFQYGWSTPVHWRHDGTDEIVVLGGDFKPNQRLMAYNLADGAERWWVGGLPPSGKSTPVIGDGLLFFAAPDIILETAAEKRAPDRAAAVLCQQRGSRHGCTAGQQGRSRSGQYRLVGEKGCARCSVTFVLQRKTLHVPERRYCFLSSSNDRRVVVQRTAGSTGLLLFLTSRCRPEDLHCIRRGRDGGAGCW